MRPQRRRKRNSAADSGPHGNGTCFIEDLTHDGRGLARTPGGKTCFVSGALPGEKVEYRVNNRKRNFDEATTLRVLEPSADRVSPPCPHFARCGGCTQQHLAVEQQIKYKQQHLLRALQRGGLECGHPVTPLHLSSWHYRRRARLAVQRARDGEFLVGFRNPGSRRIEPLRECRILEQRLAALIPLLPAWLADVCGDQRMIELELVAGDTQIAVAIESERRPLTPSAKGKAHGLGSNCQLWWKSPAMPEFERIDGGEGELSYALDELKLHFRPGQFVQINAEINRGVVHQLLDWVEDGGNTALDLYCGIGNFSLPLAQRFNRVIAVEGMSSLVDSARSNATLNGLTNTEFRVADLSNLESLQSILARHFDLILLDPPRQGAAAIMPSIAASDAQKIAYISCHPATLVRDAQVLIAAGYRLDRVGVVDMFPHTNHIEAMALFRRSRR